MARCFNRFQFQFWPHPAERGRSENQAEHYQIASRTSVAGDNIKDTTPSTLQVKSSSPESLESTNNSGVMAYFGRTTPRTQDEILAR